MENSEFEWDDEKAKRNLKKHGVSFEEGATIFNDTRIAAVSDPDHSEDDERYIAIGMSAMKRLLTVSLTYRNEKIRLVSCRKATKSERKDYESE